MQWHLNSKYKIISLLLALLAYSTQNQQTQMCDYIDTIGTKNFVRCSEVSLAQGLVIDHTPPIIAASYDKALLWTAKKTVLMRDLSTDSS